MKWQIWNKRDEILTPSGQTFTAAEWMERYPAAATVDYVISAGVVNGAEMLQYDALVSSYEAAGCDWSDADILAAIGVQHVSTKPEHLAYMEKWEELQQAAAAAAAEQAAAADRMLSARIAGALEDLVVLNMPDMVE